MSRIANNNIRAWLEVELNEENDEMLLGLAEEHMEVAMVRRQACLFRMTRNTFLSKYSDLKEELKTPFLEKEDEPGYLVQTKKGYAWYKKEEFERTLIGEIDEIEMCVYSNYHLI
tara:strand:- start:1372 stop:1716 length:345 start_codon:yes stop_codon:yes gene_type:complete